MTTALLRAASDQIIDHAMQFDELLKYSNSLCTGLSSVDELLRASSEFYNFCVQQYEWSINSTTTAASSSNQESTGNNTNKSVNNNGSTNSNKQHISDQESKSRKHHESELENEREVRPSIRDLVDAFDMK